MFCSEYSKELNFVDIVIDQCLTITWNCTSLNFEHFSCRRNKTVPFVFICSHCEGHQWTPLCCGLSSTDWQDQTEARHPCGLRHDHTYHYEVRRGGEIIIDSLVKDCGISSAFARAAQSGGLVRHRPILTGRKNCFKIRPNRLSRQQDWSTTQTTHI